MAGRLFLAATLVAVHSFLPVIAGEIPATITLPPAAKRTPSHHDIANRQAATSPLPLTEYQYPYSAIPYQVNPFPVGRGPQSGYNICNSTTEGPSSECQTLIVNSLSDFCIWGSPTANGLIGNVEAAVVAYCTQPGHGTRIITPGSITAAQFMKTSAYIQITGLFNQNGIGLASNDTGGELDPHGADLLGNPLGGIVYSTGLPSATSNNTYTQATNWNNFVGSGVFCIKLCDPTVTSPDYCENTFDLLGCSYNMPASYTPNQFTSCEGELQDVVGTYTSNGAVYTWSQPATLPATSTLPWTPRIPASSNCVTYSSAQLFPAASTSSSASVATATVSGTGKGATPQGASPTGSAAGSHASNGAGRVAVSTGLLATLVGVVAVLV